MINLTYLAQSITKGDIPNLPTTDLSGNTFETILQIVFGTAAAIAFLVIVIAGLRYTLSQGEPQGINRAKDTIIYAVVGLFVAMMAFSIVTFVIKGTT